MITDKEIKINKGLDGLQFGKSIDFTVQKLGQPDHIEELEGMDEENSIAYIYDEMHLIVFFEGINDRFLTIIETKDPESTLFGQKIFEMDEVEVHQLMKENNFEELETEVLTWGGKRVSFEDANIDFYFEDNKLSAVNWGTFITEADEMA